MHALRVAHCVHGLGLGGAQKVIGSIVRGSSRDSFRYFVYSSEDGVHRAEIERAGATVRVIPRSLPKLDPVWALRLARALREDQIDIAHVHLFGDSLHGYLASKVAGSVPVVMTLHIGVEGMSRLQRVGYRWLLARTHVVACSEFVARSIRADLFPGCDLIVIANGIDDPCGDAVSTPDPTQIRATLGIEPSAIVLASIGRLSEQKGHTYLLRAFAKLVSTPTIDAKLLILGDGELRGGLERQARELGIADRVSFLGVRDDIVAILSALEIVVFGSLYEGLPVALLEAMAMRRCVVATDIPGIVEAARPEREALIVPTADADALGEALDRVARDPSLRDRLGRAARERYEQGFTSERMVGAYEDLYRRVARHSTA